MLKKTNIKVHLKVFETRTLQRWFHCYSICLLCHSWIQLWFTRIQYIN